MITNANALQSAVANLMAELTQGQGLAA